VSLEEEEGREEVAEVVDAGDRKGVLVELASADKSNGLAAVAEPDFESDLVLVEFKGVEEEEEEREEVRGREEAVRDDADEFDLAASLLAVAVVGLE
jgi:hypothetical protein